MKGLSTPNGGRVKVIICEDGIKTFPFDVNHVLVQQYHHMGEGIDYGEVERFRTVLTEIILAVYNQTPRPKDSPVYTFLKQLTPPALAAAMQGIAEAAAKSARWFTQGDHVCCSCAIGWSARRQFALP
jgi:hypothetical protein